MSECPACRDTGRLPTTATNSIMYCTCAVGQLSWSRFLSHFEKPRPVQQPANRLDQNAPFIERGKL